MVITLFSRQKKLTLEIDKKEIDKEFNEGQNDREKQEKEMSTRRSTRQSSLKEKIEKLVKNREIIRKKQEQMVINFIINKLLFFSFLSKNFKKNKKLKIVKKI